MLVSDRKEFVFIHNPKCAGTSVRIALMPFETTGNFFWMADDFNGQKVDKAHLPLFILRDKYPSYFDRVIRYFCFAFVRDPYVRTISAFNETRRQLLEFDGDEEKKNDYKRLLNEFICQTKPNSLNGLHFMYRHFVRQRDMIYLGRKRHVDLVMKVEEWPACLGNLRLFMPEIAAVLHRSPRRNAKSVSSASVLELLSDVSVKKINELYEDDFRLFGYRMISP